VEATSLSNKLKLLTLFRLLVAVVFLLATFFGIQDEVQFLSREGREIIYGAITGLMFLCVVSAGLLERWQDPGRLTVLAYVHFVGDALFATCLVTLTGGVESIFTFLYSLAIINASIALFRRGAVFLAAFNTVCLAVVAAAQMDMLGPLLYKVMADGTVLWHREVARSVGGILPSLTVNVLAFFGIAFLSSYLAEQMRSADVRARQHEAGFKELTNLHEAIVSSLENGLLTVGMDRRIAFVNQRTCQLLGRSESDLIGRNVGDLFPDMGRVLENPDKARRSHSETTIQMLGGRRTYLRWTISPLKGPDGRQVGSLLLFFDVTRMKEMEFEVERAERLAALGRMAANIAHEIRNPLASMSGSIQLLADSIDVAGEAQRESMLVGELADEVVEMLRNDERVQQVQLTCESRSDTTVVGDRARIRQVIWNLCLNAVEALNGNGHVRITVHGEADRVVLQVRDDGPGIAPEQAQRVFEPFFTTKAQGTGLGLATVHRNVEEHGGSIQVETGEGTVGTTFVVILPRSPRIPDDELDLPT
jgi:two-component system sensor histidine kinase PilS (NtrC family)